MVNEVRDLTMGIRSSFGRSAPMGYALWEYTASGWNLRKNAAVPGAVPASAPKAAGQFVGQIRAIPCVEAS